LGQVTGENDEVRLVLKGVDGDDGLFQGSGVVGIDLRVIEPPMRVGQLDKDKACRRTAGLCLRGIGCLRVLSETAPSAGIDCSSEADHPGRLQEITSAELL
jgi:hypothetical protein